MLCPLEQAVMLACIEMWRLSTPGLPWLAVPQTVHSLANDPAFRKAQDDVLNEEYYQGSQQAAAKYGLR